MRLTSAEARVREAGIAREQALSAAVRRKLGIVHTRPELSRFVMRAVDQLLRRELGVAAGIASEAVTVIDPACGPGAFLAAALSVAGTREPARPRLVGLDVDAAVLAVARRALPCLPASQLVLRQADVLEETYPQALAAEARLPVVVGNPPWVARAQAPPGPRLAALLQDFRRDHRGEPLRERKQGVLADAYVRFLRFGAEVARLGQRGGALALLTNSSYLDGPVHRGLRAALLSWFDLVTVFDLGGNALIARRGARDDNLFGVRPGAAVLLALRRGHAAAGRRARFAYLRLGGAAQQKLSALGEPRALESARAVIPRAPLFVFGPRAARPDPDGFAGWPSLGEVMPFHREGVQTNRDAVVVDRDRGRLVARLHALAEGRAWPELAPARSALRHYHPERARERVAEALREDPTGRRGRLVRRIAYRPFDVRFFTPVAPLCHRPRPALLGAMAHSELALVTVRKDRGREPWAHAAVAREVIDNCFLSTRSSCRARAFPTHAPDGGVNLDAGFAARFAERVEQTLCPLDFVHYCLSVLMGERYRTRHLDALRLDYPRIPWPRDATAFARARDAGRAVAQAFVSAARRDGSASLTVGHHRLRVSKALAGGFARAAHAGDAAWM